MVHFNFSHCSDCYHFRAKNKNRVNGRCMILQEERRGIDKTCKQFEDW